MAERHRMTADEVVAKLMSEEHVDFLRESLRWVVGQLMEAEVSELVGAGWGERSDDRATHRNGYRPRRWDTRAGEIELQIPKLRRGSNFPSFLEPRRRSEQALLNVVQQAYVCGVSTRKVDQLVESLGLRISRSEVSRISAGLDEQVEVSARGRLPLQARAAGYARAVDAQEPARRAEEAAARLTSHACSWHARLGLQQLAVAQRHPRPSPAPRLGLVELPECLACVPFALSAHSQGLGGQFELPAQPRERFTQVLQLRALFVTELDAPAPRPIGLSHGPVLRPPPPSSSSTSSCLLASIRSADTPAPEPDDLRRPRAIARQRNHHSACRRCTCRPRAARRRRRARLPGPLRTPRARQPDRHHQPALRRVDQGLPRPQARQGHRRPPHQQGPHHRHRQRVLALPPRPHAQDPQAMTPAAKKRPGADRRSASPSGLGSATTGARHHHRPSGNIYNTNQPTRSRGHLNPSRRGHCKPSLSSAARTPKPPRLSAAASKSSPRRRSRIAARVHDPMTVSVASGCSGWPSQLPLRTFLSPARRAASSAVRASGPATLSSPERRSVRSAKRWMTVPGCTLDGYPWRNRAIKGSSESGRLRPPPEHRRAGTGWLPYLAARPTSEQHLEAGPRRHEN